MSKAIFYEEGDEMRDPPFVLPYCLKPTELAEFLGLGRTTTYRLIAEGKIRSVKVGKRLIIPAAAVEEFLNGEQTKQLEN